MHLRYRFTVFIFQHSLRSFVATYTYNFYVAVIQAHLQFYIVLFK